MTSIWGISICYIDRYVKDKWFEGKAFLLNESVATRLSYWSWNGYGAINNYSIQKKIWMRVAHVLAESVHGLSREATHHLMDLNFWKYNETTYEMRKVFVWCNMRLLRWFFRNFQTLHYWSKNDMMQKLQISSSERK